MTLVSLLKPELTERSVYSGASWTLSLGVMMGNAVVLTARDKHYTGLGLVTVSQTQSAKGNHVPRHAWITEDLPERNSLARGKHVYEGGRSA